jgi:hypothetical protein
METGHLPEVGNTTLTDQTAGINRCRARNRQGERCGKPAHPGAVVCRLHGGAAPQVKRKAALRLASLVDPAIAVLAQVMTDKDAKPGDRLRATNSILDRAGIVRQQDMDVEAAQALLVQRLLEARASRDEAFAEIVSDVGELEE